MKKLIAMAIATAVILAFAPLGFAAGKATDKCVACHRGENALDRILEKNKIKTNADFMKAIKEGSTARVHARFSDNDIKAAAKELKLAK